MTRKQRSQGGNTTYNLSNPRNVAAFEALLEEEEPEDVGRQSKASPQPPPPGRKKREKEKFFKLKSDDRLATDNSSNSAPHQQSLGTLQQLQVMFQEAADPSVIADVYQAVGSNFDAAVEALFGLLGTAGKDLSFALMLLGALQPGFEPPISCKGVDPSSHHTPLSPTEPSSHQATSCCAPVPLRHP